MADPVDVEVLAQLLEKATPGPWGAADEHGLMPGATPAWCVSRMGMPGHKWLYDVAYGAGNNEENDALLIAAAVTALPALLGELRLHQQQRATAIRLCNYWDTLSAGDQYYASQVRAALGGRE